MPKSNCKSAWPCSSTPRGIPTRGCSSLASPSRRLTYLNPRPNRWPAPTDQTATTQLHWRSVTTVTVPARLRGGSVFGVALAGQAHPVGATSASAPAARTSLRGCLVCSPSDEDGTLPALT